MPKSTTEDYTRSSEKQRSLSRSTAGFQVPLHFAIHKPGCHFESCCGICNLFPGVLLIAFTQVLVGSILLTLILTHGPQYDEMHMTPTTQFISLATGIVLSGITGAGLLLIVVALTENCRAMLVYLLVATIVWLGLVSLGVTKIGRACVRFQDAPKIKAEEHRLANLACVSGLLTFLGAVLYFFSIVVVFSFYHFRYVRRAILLHENECE
uniref:SFRICE_005153 n=1 Tax=Spodoptera frugiperda TaxID=7108 RepID=A0A2H1VL86_SPOFR